MKFTYEEIILFRANASKWIDRNKELSKFKYGLQKMISRTNFVEKRINEYLDDIRTENASVDEKGNIIITNDKMVYTIDGQKKINSAYREKLKEKVEIEIFLVRKEDMPELGADWEDILLPFVTEETKLEVSKNQKKIA